MGLLLVLAFFVALAVLGPRYGVDSRPHRETTGRRPGRDPSWWPNW